MSVADFFDTNALLHLLDEHAIQGDHVGPMGAPLHAAQGRAAAQRFAGADRRLHQGTLRKVAWSFRSS